MNWIPTTEAELRALLDRSALEESAVLELKREVGSRSLEVAKDIAAMANDGGVILYGVAEDDHGQPGSLSPFPLAGAAARIDAIVSTAISEPPLLEIKTIPSESEEGAGYLVVVVPPSIRAPHMVVVKGHNRFYGRSAKGNVPLTEGDVARLYQRRQQAETDAEQLLEELISHAPREAAKGGAWLHLVAKRMLPRETLVEDALPSTRHPFDELIKEARAEGEFEGQYSPHFSESRARQEVEGWLLQMGSENAEDRALHSCQILDLVVDFNGRLELFCGRAADYFGRERLEVFDILLAGITVCFLCFAGALYQRASYLGQVTLGIAVTGIRGARSRHMSGGVHGFWAPRFEQDRFTRADQVVAAPLKDEPRAVAQRLLGRFCRGLTQGQCDPLEDHRPS